MLINKHLLFMENLFNFSPEFLVLVPLVLGLVEVIKRIGLPTRWVPIASIVLSIGGLFLAGVAWQPAIMSGIFVGLSACGLWSGTKTTVGY